MSRHVQNIRNTKLAISLVYLKKEVKNEIGFCMKINIKVFYKFILLFLLAVVRHAQSTQNYKLQYLFNISRKKWGMEFIVCMQINIKVFYKLMLTQNPRPFKNSFYPLLQKNSAKPPPFANCQNCNLGKNLLVKSTRLSNIGFPIECFTAGFSQFCSTTVKICLLDGGVSTLSLVRNMSGIFLKFPNFLRS